MSLTSKSRKESSESNAAQRMGNTMGQHPETGQLYDRDLRADLTSKRADSSDVDPQDVQPIDDEPTNQVANDRGDSDRVEAVRRDTVEDAEMTRDRDSLAEGNITHVKTITASDVVHKDFDGQDSLRRNPDGPIDELGHS
ncbi:hypothetical protein [Tellurirhabdus rosea]|uniref:hypothetical protein n=1 Tax=Tellurirhabdus rosea TaxID=2674997 RepID=UPI0022551FCB|nr:hypothetical protein [Tellurirhabdus rosea]